MTVHMFKDGLRVVPPVLMAPFEIVVANEKEQAPIKIEFDEDGLHFLTPWGMCSIRKEDLYETSNSVLP